MCCEEFHSIDSRFLILNSDDLFEERNDIQPFMLAVAQPAIIEVVAVDVDSGAFRFLAPVLYF